MDCSQAREWLLAADRPWDAATLPQGVAEHVSQCDICRRTAARIESLESNWRDHPLPASIAAAPERFLNSLPAAEAVSVARPRRRLSFRWAVAAGLMLTFGVGGGLFWFPQTAKADEEVVEELVDLNLELANTPVLAERREASLEKTKRLKARVQKAKLTKAQRQLAESLLASADWLVENADPMETAGQFHSLRDRLLLQLREASDAQDAAAVRRLLRQYNKITEEGFAASLEKAEAAPQLDFRNQGWIEKMALRDSEHMKALADLLEKSPNATRKEIKRALDKSRQREKQRKKVPDRRRDL